MNPIRQGINAYGFVLDAPFLQLATIKLHRHVIIIKAAFLSYGRFIITYSVNCSVAASLINYCMTMISYGLIRAAMEIG